MIAPEIDPVAIAIGPIKIHWYGLMYLFGFGGGWLAGVYRARQPGSGWTPQEVSDVVFYLALGTIIGGRLGYVFFYNFSHYLQHPLEIFYLWKGGMSFHGGLLGVVGSLWFFSRKTGKTWMQSVDYIAVLAPIGLFFGRFGNFINHELWGKPTDLPWGMVFRTGGPEPRHPTQLYEMFSEGLLLFIVLWIFTMKPRPAGAASGVMVIGYGISRMLVELVRVPDAHIGYLAFGWLTMGHILSLPMVLGGIGLLVYAYRFQREH